MNSKYQLLTGKILAALAALAICGTTSLIAHENGTTSAKALKVGTVDFKKAIEVSKAGKQQQVSFDALKKQMETVLDEREGKLNEIAEKFNDPDYIDSLSAEAEAELKHKFRVLSQELSQIQNQCYQALNQANMKILQELNDQIVEASKKLAQDGKYDLILNNEGCFFCNSSIDVTDEITKLMDAATESAEKANKTTASTP
jgi:outer membrane protein